MQIMCFATSKFLSAFVSIEMGHFFCVERRYPRYFIDFSLLLPKAPSILFITSNLVAERRLVIIVDISHRRFNPFVLLVLKLDLLHFKFQICVSKYHTYANASCNINVSIDKTRCTHTLSILLRV